jgi:translation initiation factor 3 subunit A
MGASGGVRLESDAMRSQLTQLSKQLSFVCRIINPPDVQLQLTAQQTLYSEVRSMLDVEHKEALLRKDLIEKRKEEAERVALEKVKEEEMKRLEAISTAKAEEEKRLQREQQLREREKIEKIRKEMEIMEKKRYLQAMGHNTDIMTEEELLAMDGVALAKQHADEAAKKKDHAEKKIKELQKTLDYIVRATRIEEIPLIQKRRSDKIRFERERYEAEVVEKARNAKLQWEADCNEKSELSGFSVFLFMDKFKKSVMKVRKVAHEDLCKEEDKRAENEAELSKLQRARRRKQDAERRQKLEEERLKKEEEDRMREEENCRREEEKRKKEEEEELLKRKEMERMSAERERQDREREMSVPAHPKPLDGDAPPVQAKYVPPSKRGGTDQNRSGHEGSRSSFGDSRGSSFGGGRYEGRMSSFGSDRSSSNAWRNDRR